MNRKIVEMKIRKNEHAEVTSKDVRLCICDDAEIINEICRYQDARM